MSEEFGKYQAGDAGEVGSRRPGDRRPSSPADPLRLSYRVASTLHVHPRERQHLLELDDVASRLQEELTHAAAREPPAPITIGPFSIN